MRTLVWCLATFLSFLVAPAAMGQDRGLAIEYTVKVADIPRQLFHVITDIRNINQPSLDLSLPVWSPGWYVIENYGKNSTVTNLLDTKFRFWDIDFDNPTIQPVRAVFARLTLAFP